MNFQKGNAMAYITKRIDNSLKRAALYARVSTEEQAMHGVSLDAQKERLLQYAKDNDLTVVDLYVDEGISARKRYTRRPQFLRMLEDVKQNKIDVVLFIKLDRWFRNIADYYEVQAILDKYRVQWIATEEDYDTTTANGRLALNIKLAIAQDESDRTSERIKFVFNNMVKEGRVISGSTPIGYKIVDKRAVIDENAEELVKTMFHKYIDCRSVKETSRHLNSLYGTSIDVKTMKHMLTNTWYIGEAYGIKDWCPAIIDEPTFRLAGQIVETRAARYNGARSDRIYLFTGLIHCPCCDRRMTTYSCSNKDANGNVKQEFIYYRCPAHTMKTCDMGKQYNQKKLEEQLIECVCSEAEKFNFNLAQQKKALPKKKIDTAKVMKRIEKLKDLYLSDLIPKEIYERDYLELTAILREAEAKEEQVRTLTPIDVTALKDFTKSYEKLAPESRKALWSRILKKITVTPSGDLELTFNQL